MAAPPPPPSLPSSPPPPPHLSRTSSFASLASTPTTSAPSRALSPTGFHPSSGVGAGGSSSAAADVARRKRAKDLLREHYGLGSRRTGAGLGAVGEGEVKAGDMDTPNFDSKAYYEELVTTANLPELLKRSNELAAEIKELDGERQSLVYNHHHELIAASDTIRDMKVRADSLEPSLDHLRSSFSTISQLSASHLSSTPPPPASPTSPTSRRPDTLKLLGKIAGLPDRLAELLDAGERERARALWERRGKVVRGWEERGVRGAREIMEECEEVLRAAEDVDS